MANTDEAETIPVEGIHPEEVTDWFATHVPEAQPPLAFDLLAGGRSNLTYSVTDRTGARWVLRRPPLGHVLATAHDMGREHRIISALAPTPVPVAPIIGLSPDDSVNGAPFYVMAFVDGPIVRNAEGARQLPVAHRARATESIVDVLAEIHAVDDEAVGLGDLGRPEGYIERQLKRWQGPRQLRPRRRGEHPGRARLGALHPGRSPGRRRPALHVLDGARRHPGRRS